MDRLPDKAPCTQNIVHTQALNGFLYRYFKTPLNPQPSTTLRNSIYYKGTWRLSADVLTVKVPKNTSKTLKACVASMKPNVCKACKLVLASSWVVISGVINKVTILITLIRRFITPLITTHEPPSMSRKD